MDVLNTVLKAFLWNWFHFHLFWIQGYWSPKSLIAAQGPLADTIPEFWQMVYQKKVKNIVMLSKCKEGDQVGWWRCYQQSYIKALTIWTYNTFLHFNCVSSSQELCAEYWGQEKKTYKDISVEETSSVTSPAYIKRTIQLHHAKVMWCWMCLFPLAELSSMMAKC